MEINLNLFWIAFIVFLGVVVFLIHSGFNVNLFVKKDEHIADKFLDKFPLVVPDFINKNLREQNIENNQEIHELNKRMEVLEAELSKIQFLLSRLNVQQSMTYNEIKGNKN